MDMFLFIINFCEYQDVVNIDNYYFLHVCKDIIHYGLEHGRGIALSEVYNQGHKSALVANESSFPFVAFLDLDVVVFQSEIHLGK